LTHVSVVARVVPEEEDDNNSSEIGARDGGGDAGADHAEHGETPVAEDEKIVAEEVDQIGGDEREGDGADQVHALQRAAEGEVKKKRNEAEGERVHIGAGEDGDVGGNAKEVEEIG